MNKRTKGCICIALYLDPLYPFLFITEFPMGRNKIILILISDSTFVWVSDEHGIAHFC